MKRGIECALVGVLCAAIGCFYVWTVRSSGDPWKFGEEQRDYYNLLIDGYLSGQLHMKVEVSPELLKLKDPYDPTTRPAGIALHDASFYRGKYYVYFGAAPMVVLMLPFRLLTGVDLPQAVAALVFVYGAFAASVAVWLGVRRRYFPEAGAWVTLTVVAVLGCAGLEPVLLRRPHMWELPIGAGSCFAMLTLGCIWASLHSERRRTWWFAAAGLALALAIASRPTYLMACPLLAVPVIWWWHAERRWPWRTIAGAAVPLALVGTAMAWHNYARFDDPLQFGQAYQLSLDYESKVEHFSARYAGFNLRRYFFSPAQWSWYFPFIQPADLPPKPRGFAGHDDVYGVLRNLPIAWLAVLAPLALWRREKVERGRLAAWLASAFLLFASPTAVLVCFFGSLARYQSDFAPALMLLACVGVLAFERWVMIAWPQRARWLPALAWLGAAAWSVLFAILFSLQLDGLLQESNPAKARAVARAWNRVPAALEKMLRLQRGAVEATVRLIPHADGTRALLAVGDPPRQVLVVVDHLDARRVRFGVLPPGAPPIFSRPLEFDFARPHELKVLLGSMLPPATHPLFAARTPAEIAAGTKRVQLDLDGETLIDERRRFEPGTSRVRIGAELNRATTGGFDGQVTGVRRRAAEAAMSADLAPAGFVRLRLRLPAQASVPREPLLAIGRPANALVLYVYSLDDSGRIAFGTSLRGERAPESDAIAVDRGAVQDVVVRWYLSGDAGRRHLEVRVDGTIVMSRAVAWPERDDAVAIGRNLPNEPGCAAAFTGVVHQVQRSADGQDPLFGPGDTLRLRLELPARAAAASPDCEPLVVTGRSGGGDLFTLEYLGDFRVRFGLDHWGSGLIASPPVRLAAGKPLEIEVTLGSMARLESGFEEHVKRGVVRVVVDGTQVWREAADFFTADADEVVIARNPIGGTSAGPAFTGNLLSVERVQR